MNYYLGIDVSKGYADLILLDSQKNIIEKNFQLDDTFQGHNQLSDLISNFFSKHSKDILYASVESTGGYENNWLNTLQKLQTQFNLFAVRLNPKGVHHNSIAGMKRIITDKVSAQNIAEYMINHPEKINLQANDPFASLRSQWNYIRMLSKQKVQLVNQLEKLLYRASPELMVYWKKKLPNWMIQLIIRYPTSKKLSKAKADKVAQLSYITVDKARKIVEKAKNSVASANDPYTETLITSLGQEILHKQQLIDRQTELMISRCHLPEVKLLETIPGVGTYSAIGLVLEIGTVSRFASAKKLSSFFGLHPKYKQSGDGTWGMRMSKEGRSQPREILFMVTLVAIQHNPIIQEIFAKNLSKGKCKLDAIGVCMHKMLRIIYGMLRTNTPFNPEIDRQNQKKSHQKRKGSMDKKLRRYQKQDPDAPISYRQTKTRKEQHQSQGDQVTKHEIRVSALSSIDT